MTGIDFQTSQRKPPKNQTGSFDKKWLLPNGITILTYLALFNPKHCMSHLADMVPFSPHNNSVREYCYL